MCIRDRGVGRRVDVDQARRRPSQFDGRHGGHGRVGHGDDPVSYTHLRAHETVLDLVCRLLLEKKHTNHSIYQEREVAYA